nr:hypothetical protein [Lacticaseibacillus paracasei]
MAAWKIATVQPDYHILVDRMFYSVPFQYIGSQVDVCLTNTLVEIFFKDSRIASHARLYGRKEQFSTNQEHMPEAHKMYISHTPESSREWAATIGESVGEVVTYFLNHMLEQQALHKILSLQKLGVNYPPFPFLPILKRCRIIIIYQGCRKYGQSVQDKPQ